MLSLKTQPLIHCPGCVHEFAGVQSNGCLTSCPGMVNTQFSEFSPYT